MSMNPRLFGYRSKDDEHYQKMLKVKHSCEEANIKLPAEVEEYFDYGDDDEPLRVELNYSESNDGSIELQVKDIPEGVSTVKMEWV